MKPKNTIDDKLLRALLQGKPIEPCPMWVAYYDMYGREIGKRDPITEGFNMIKSSTSLVFPPSSEQRNGVAKISVVDSAEGPANALFETWTGGNFIDRIMDFQPGDQPSVESDRPFLA